MPIERAPDKTRPVEVDEDSNGELLVSQWAKSRSGARAGRGFHFQDEVGAWLATRLACGVGPPWLVPEGFEDLTLEGDEPTHVQVKSRVEHLDKFPPSTASRHILDAWERHASRGHRGAVLIVVLERGVTGEEDLNGLDDLDTSLADRMGDGSALMTNLESRATSRGMSQHELSELLATTVVVGASRAGVLAATTTHIRSQWDLPPSALRLVARQLCSDVADAADANATASYETRRRLDRTAVVSTIEQVVAQLDLESLEFAIRQGICETLEYPESQPGDDRYYEGTATQPSHVASNLVVPRPELVAEALSGLDDRSATVITGPSGVGKSAVLWTIPLALPGVLWFRVKRLSAPDVPHLIRLARAYSVAHDQPVGFLLDGAGTTEFTGWAELRSAAAALPGLLLMATARAEDLFVLGDLSTCASIDVRLDEAAAETIFTGLVRRRATDAAHWMEAFEASRGLTLEFTHLLTRGNRLGDVINEQVRRRIDEERHDELDVLALTSVADRWSARLSTGALAEACGLADFQLRAAISRLAAEHLIVERDGEVGGLHRLRSVALCDAIHLLPPPRLTETIKRVVPRVPDPQLYRFAASMLVEMPDIHGIVMEAEISDVLDAERFVGLAQGLRLAGFYERAREWKQIAQQNNIPVSNQPVLILFATAGLEFPDMFPPELRTARDAMQSAVDQGFRDALTTAIGHAEVADLIASESSLDRATRMLEVMDGSPPELTSALRAALGAETSFEESLQSASLDDLTRCIAATRGCDPELAAHVVGLLGGEPAVLRRIRAENPWIIELDTRSVDGESIGYCRFLHVSDSAQPDFGEESVALGRLLLRCLPNIDGVDVQALWPGGLPMTIGNHTLGISRLQRQYDHTPADLAWNQVRLRAAQTLLGVADTTRLSQALPLLERASQLILHLGNGLVSGRERDLETLNAQLGELHEGAHALHPPLGSVLLGDVIMSSDVSILAPDNLSALITDLTGNVFQRLNNPDGYRVLAAYISETVLEKHLQGAIGEPWQLIGVEHHPACLNSLRSTLLDLYVVIKELSEADADAARIGRSARSGTPARALQRAAETCRKAERRRNQTRRTTVQSTFRETGLAAKIRHIDHEHAGEAQYLVSVDVASLLDWPAAVASLEEALGTDRPIGETFVFVPLRDGRPVPSLATKLIGNLWPFPNPEGLDMLPEPHPSTFADLFNQCQHSLQTLSGISQLPDEQQSHKIVLAVVDSATSEFATAVEQMHDLPSDTVVSDLLELLAETAVRVQSELEGTSTESCFAEQITTGMSEGGGVPEFDTIILARYLALEWDIDASDAVTLYDSLGYES